MLGEFDLIEKFFTKETDNSSVSLSVGDDCALVDTGLNRYLAVTTDTLNEGIHYFKNEEPFFIGYKSLLVNVSDLASMGARPEYFTLSVTLKEADEVFLKGFSDGLFTLAGSLGMTLIGGNTSKGQSDSFTIEAMGYVPHDLAMLRSNAKCGDLICVTGDLGAPALFVEYGYGRIQLDTTLAMKAHARAMLMADRCSFACELRNICKCAIDISDGLYGDLNHILQKSHMGAIIDVNTLPVSDMVLNAGVCREYALNLALFGGGDYELLFTLHSDRQEQLFELARKHDVNVSIIGRVTDSGVIYLKDGQSEFITDKKAFEHF